MAYVAPTTRSDGYVVPASVWNQDVCANPIALRAQADALDVLTLKLVTESCDGRLTLTSGTPVTTSDVTAATTLYFTPYKGKYVGLYTGAAWTLHTLTELSIAVPATTSTMYDVFLDYNAGTPVLAVTAWTNDTTRATALTTQDGIYVQTGNTDWRYLGSFRTTGVSGQTEDSFAKRYVWNYRHRVSRPMRVVEATNTWNYTTATYRQANNAAANQLDCVIGVVEDCVDVSVVAYAANSSANTDFWVSIGNGSTTTPITGVVGQLTSNRGRGANLAVLGRADWRGFPSSVGRNYYVWLEKAEATGTNTFYGDNGDSTQTQSGIHGVVRG